MSIKYLPTNDYVFKRIFGRKENTDITENFLETVIDQKFEEIDVEENPILKSDLTDNKLGILDVKITADKVNNIDIEMQVAKSAYIADRILWYWAMMYTSLGKGKTYNSTKRGICILIADFNLDVMKNYLETHSSWHVRQDKHNELILTNKLEIHIIELKKLEQDINVTKELKQWCEFIKNPEKVGNSIMEENKYIKKAKEELEKINADEHERMLAELRDKAIRDEIAIRDGGYIDGKEDGIKEGIKQGENNKSIEIAKNMLKENMDIKLISKLTGLTEEEIKDIKI